MPKKTERDDITIAEIAICELYDKVKNSHHSPKDAIQKALLEELALMIELKLNPTEEK